MNALRKESDDRYFLIGQSASIISGNLILKVIRTKSRLILEVYQRGLEHLKPLDIFRISQIIERE